MSIQVKFFASLRERVGKAEAELNPADKITALQVWQQSTGEDELSANILIAVNLDYVDSKHMVNDGDEVAFFPPVTGG